MFTLHFFLIKEENLRFLLLVLMLDQFVPFVHNGDQLFQKELLSQFLCLRLLPIYIRNMRINYSESMLRHQVLSGALWERRALREEKKVIIGLRA